MIPEKEAVLRWKPDHNTTGGPVHSCGFISACSYQKALPQSAAEEAAEAGAAVLVSGTESWIIRPDRESDGFRLYRRLYDSDRRPD